ncbi:MAG: DUF1761 domain-containing protein [Gemmatimonadota bacterium]|nr:DUF1761 domain-containing protein [Gemmatimonadota bacterium]
MEPVMNVNYLAIAACVVVAMPVGFLWFGPLFGSSWAKHMGMESMEQPDGAAMGKSMGLFALGNLLIAFVFFHTLEVWRPSVWGLGEDQPAYAYALYSALFTWAGFFVPMQLGRIAWEQKRWGLVGINAGFDLVRLLMFAFILAYWR